VSTGLIIVTGIAAVLIAVVWFFFMAPLEKQMQERQMEMIQKKLEKRRQQAAERGDEDGE
jgi:F0F1-type ATP synthase membrane subunit b/b'